MNQMQAMVLTRFGGPGVLECHTVERPVPRTDQMLVRVAACGVCGHDLLNRQGYFPETKPPCVMGHEIASTVETVGELVRGFGPGDCVALTQRTPAVSAVRAAPVRIISAATNRTSTVRASRADTGSSSLQARATPFRYR
jgi:NADPH:quinone reductase-like Zn-dependent oxidoreductase